MPPAAIEEYRPLDPGMGVAVAERTYLRRILTDRAAALLDPEIRLHPRDPHLKPWLVALVVVLLSPLRGGRAEAGNVIRAIRAARGMRTVPPASVD